MSEVTHKVRLQVGSYYHVSYDPDGTTETTVDCIGIFQGKTPDGVLIFTREGMDDLAISPGEVTSLAPVRNRIQPKIKMGKPRNIYLPTQEVEDPRSGKIFNVCEEEAEILCRSFGYKNLTKPPFTEGVIDDE